jgi:hypothetical protein
MFLRDPTQFATQAHFVDGSTQPRFVAAAHDPGRHVATIGQPA